MRARSRYLPALLAVGVAAGLSSCALVWSEGPGPEDKAESATTTEAKIEDAPGVDPVTEAPDVGPRETGEIVTEEEAASLPDGQRAFALADGSLVVVTAVEAFPAQIIDELRSLIQTPGEPASIAIASNYMKVIDLQIRIRDTGRTAVTVQAVGRYEPETGELVRTAFVVESGEFLDEMGVDYDTVEEARAFAEKYVSEQADRSVYEIVDLTR